MTLDDSSKYPEDTSNAFIFAILLCLFRERMSRPVDEQEVEGGTYMNHDQRSWFVCQTKAHEEARARHFLEQKHFEVYLPTMETQRILGHRTILVQRPLFPSYLFVKFNPTTDLTCVRWTRGVRKILPESIRPVTVNAQVVETIQALAQRDGIIRKQLLKESDRVRILRGPFKDLLGIFERWTSDNGRVRILLSFVDYHARVELHHRLVAKAA